MGRLWNKESSREPTEEPFNEELQVRRAQNDIKEFIPLYDKYYPRVSRIAARWMRDPEEAKDATSDVFRKVIENLHTYRIESDGFEKWINTVAINTLRDRVKRARPRIEIPATYEDPKPGPDTVALQQIDAEQLRKALADLPAESAIVVELRSVGYASKEVAGKLGRSDDWVRTTHSRAMKELARVLKQQTVGGKRDG